MLGTIENTNNKITAKLSQARRAAEYIMQATSDASWGVKHISADELASLKLNLMMDMVLTLENDYNIAVVNVLSDYYAAADNENKKTRQFYQIITSENFIPRINDCIMQLKLVTMKLMKYPRCEAIFNAESMLNSALNIEVNIKLEKLNYEVCKCGTKMDVVPELSELHCPACLEIQTIIGAVFRDDQFYPQEGQKTKHGGYDPARHYRVWIERLQARESKVFSDSVLKKIEYVLNRDNYDRKTLSCENMREILKDSKVAATSLYDHAPLLVKMFGGPSPPALSFHEYKTLSTRFSKAMSLYDVVNPDSNNKPYYPYFIYKIIEHEFRYDPDKLRLLDSIHLQSRETVIKNDKSYEQMCRLAHPDDGLVYTPTDPSGRL